MTRRLLLTLRATLAGWITLLFIAYLLQRPLLQWAAPAIGDEWLATVRLMLDCLTLAATGWVAGYASRPRPLLPVLVFAATLAFRDFTPLLALDGPWLWHLALDAIRDSRYLDSLVTSAAAQAILFGCLIAGAMLARPAESKSLSVFRG